MPIEVVLAILVLGVATLLITQGIVVLLRRRKGAAVPAASAIPPAAPPDMKCCANPVWVAEKDVGSARGFDLMLGKCGACGTPWMSVWCVASSMGGHEPVKPADVEAMRAIKNPADLKEFMRKWVEHIA